MFHSLVLINGRTNSSKLAKLPLQINIRIVADYKKIDNHNRIIGEYAVANDILKKLGREAKDDCSYVVIYITDYNQSMIHSS